ncbi:MAG: hypothetical protein ACHQ15_04495 [Candidatus Limnocylindrales bacterium]
MSLVWALVGQTLDATTMALMVTSLGLSSEVNPIVHSWGTGPALLLKLGLMVYLVLAARLWRPRVRQTVLMLACFAGIVGAVSNVWTLV